MKKCILVFCIICFTYCKSSKKKPALSIPFDTMKVIMWDLFRADAYVANYITKDSTKKVKQASIELYEKIFLLHKVDKEKFYTNCVYYLKNPDKHKILLDSIIAMVNRNKDTLTTKKDTGISLKNKDSLFFKNPHLHPEKHAKDTLLKNDNAVRTIIKDSLDIKKNKPKIKTKRKRNKKLYR